MKKRKIAKRTMITCLIALGIAGLLTLSTMSRISKTADMAVSDVLYQRPYATRENIVIIGIDEKTLSAVDADTPWERQQVARVLELTACLLEFGNSLQIASGTKADYMLSSYFSSSRLNDPYNALRFATKQGHVNSALDTDGILCHHLLRLEHNGESIPSFALAISSEKRMGLKS